jgi:hypothetical protein
MVFTLIKLFCEDHLRVRWWIALSRLVRVRAKLAIVGLSGCRELSETTLYQVPERRAAGVQRKDCITTCQ